MFFKCYLIFCILIQLSKSIEDYDDYEDDCDKFFLHKKYFY